MNASSDLICDPSVCQSIILSKSTNIRPSLSFSRLVTLANSVIESKVEFEDGHKVAMAANAIASNLFAQVDQDG